MQTTMKYRCISIASVWTTLLYPCLFMYFVNVSVANFRDILPITAVFILFSAVAFCLLLLLMKSVAKTSLILNLILLMFLNFKFIENLFQMIIPRIFYWHVVYICFALIGVAVYLVHTRASEGVAKNINMFALLAFSALISINFITAVPVIARKIGSDIEQSNTLRNTTGSAQPSDNIYFFIFDEYGGYNCLLRYCDYDNIDFYNALQDRGFNVSLTTESQGTGTTLVVPGLMHMNYVTDESMLESQRVAMLKNPYIYQYLREKNYEINVVDAHDFIDSEDVNYRFEPDFISKEGSAEHYIIENTAYYPFYTYTSSAEIESLNKQFEYAKESYKLKDSGLFTMGYFKVPHLPWFVDANGQPQRYEDRSNWLNTNAYLEQLKYTNKKILEMVDELLQNDPKCTIVLMADHGYRLPLHLQSWYDIEIEDMRVEIPYMKNVLNMVYVSGDPLEIEGESSINTLRLVMNHMFDDTLERVYA